MISHTNGSFQASQTENSIFNCFLTQNNYFRAGKISLKMDEGPANIVIINLI